MDKDETGILTVRAEELSSLNTGDPSKLVKLPKSQSLDETEAELHGAVNRIDNMVNSDLKGNQHLNTVDMATLVAIRESIGKGLDYLNVVRALILIHSNYEEVP